MNSDLRPPVGYCENIAVISDTAQEDTDQKLIDKVGILQIVLHAWENQLYMKVKSVSVFLHVG